MGGIYKILNIFSHFTIKFDHFRDQKIFFADILKMIFRLLMNIFVHDLPNVGEYLIYNRWVYRVQKMKLFIFSVKVLKFKTKHTNCTFKTCRFLYMTCPT